MSDLRLATDAPFKLLAWPRYDSAEDLRELMRAYLGVLKRRDRACLCLLHTRADPDPGATAASLQAAADEILGPGRATEALLVDDPIPPERWPELGDLVEAVVALPSSASGERAKFLAAVRQRACVICAHDDIAALAGGPPLDLRAARRNVTSQYGEDGLLEAVFQVLGVRRGTCVEFGAWDGKHLSNTHNLIANQGWSGVLIEASPERFGELLATYRDRPDVQKLERVVGLSSPDLLDDILRATPLPRDFDLLSIDIDGNDYHVFASLEAYVPKAVIIEFNPSIPNHVRFVQARDLRVNHGSSLLSLTELARQKGYELVATTTCNAVYVRRELFPRFGITDGSLAVLHPDTSLQTHVVQLFDGTLLLAGHKHLIWHGLPLDEARLQILPEDQRTYPDRLAT